MIVRRVLLAAAGWKQLPSDRVAGTQGSSLADTEGELRDHGLVLWIPDLEYPGAATPGSSLSLTCVMSFLAVIVASKMFN